MNEFGEWRGISIFNNNQMQTTDSDELFTVNKIIPRIDSNGELLINEEIINFLLEAKDSESAHKLWAISYGP